MSSVEATAAIPSRVRQVDEGDLNWALARGWDDFKEKRGDVILVALLYPLVGLLAAAIAINDRLLPLFFPLASGLSILGPAVASGFYELARRRENGQDSSWTHFFDPLRRRRSRGPLLVLTLGLTALFVAWVVIAFLIYGATLGRNPPVGIADFFRQLFTTPQGWAMIVAGNLVGFLFAAVTLAISVVSFPMIVDKGVDPGTAVATSIEAVRLNPRATAAWGLRVAGLLVLGSLPLFMGLAVVLPVLGYATWHLYTRLVER